MCFCGARGRGRIWAQGWEGWKRGHARTGTAPTGDPLVLSCSTSRHSAVPAHRPPALLPYSVAPSDHMPSQATCPAGSSCLRCLLLGAGRDQGHHTQSCPAVLPPPGAFPASPAGGGGGWLPSQCAVLKVALDRALCVAAPLGLGGQVGAAFLTFRYFQVFAQVLQAGLVKDSREGTHSTQFTLALRPPRLTLETERSSVPTLGHSQRWGWAMFSPGRGLVCSPCGGTSSFAPVTAPRGW